VPTISDGLGVLTFINVFAVEPEKRHALGLLLIAAAQRGIRHLPASCPRSRPGHFWGLSDPGRPPNAWRHVPRGQRRAFCH